jgi:hypothetical protein
MEDFFEDRPKLTLWDKISLWWRYDGRHYYRDSIQGIKNLWYWLPIIWKDRNWDHSYIYNVMMHKLSSQADYISRNDRHTRAQQDARRMKLCVKLMQICKEETYSLEYSDYHKDKHWFEPCVDKEGYSEWKSENIWETYDDYFKKYPLVYKRVMNGEGPFPLTGKNEVDIKQRIAMNIGHVNQERAHKLLFNIMEENIRGWWD